MSGQTPRFYPSRRQALLIVLVVAAIYILLPQIGDFHSSWRLLGDANAGFTAIAVVLTFATFAAGAGTYYFLAFRPLRYGRTVLVQLAATFVNRLLPAGIGALGANYLYLRHERHTKVQAGSIVAINNILGFFGHSILLLLALALFSNRSLSTERWHGPDPALLLKLGVVALAVLALVGIAFGWNRLAKALSDLKVQLANYRKRPWSLTAALGTSLTLTICNVLCLYCCAHALDLHLSFVPVLLVFTLGLGAGSAVPTPGGLGGFEAGLAAGFVAYGVDPAPALAVALLFRLISYWLPLVAGAGAFVVCQRQKLFEAGHA